MSWSALQRKRLAQERLILKEYFPSLDWHNPTEPEQTYVEGHVRVNSGRSYGLRIYVPVNFPASCPDMVVSYPSPLQDRTGQSMTSCDASMHILNQRDGHTKICHYRSSCWSPDNTLYKVAIKGRIWLEAYEAHLRTGRSLDCFLRHMTETGSVPSSSPPPPEDSEEGMFLRLLRRLFD